jgi:hypothetical protein
MILIQSQRTRGLGYQHPAFSPGRSNSAAQSEMPFVFDGKLRCSYLAEANVDAARQYGRCRLVSLPSGMVMVSGFGAYGRG